MASYPPRQCYICTGEKRIPVSHWMGDEVMEMSATCPRCQGSGTITDGFDLNAVLAMPAEPLRAFEQVCICDFRRHGPMGDPRCPAR